MSFFFLDIVNACGGSVCKHNLEKEWNHECENFNWQFNDIGVVLESR